MGLTVSYTPDKDFYTDAGVYVFNSKWLSAFNPIVFKVVSDLFPINTSDNADSYTAAASNAGLLQLTIDTGLTASRYIRGKYLTILGGVYNGTYKVLGYDPYGGTVTLDTPYLGDDTGTILPYYNNYVVDLKVFCGIPIAHKWQALRPMEEKGVLQETPDSNGQSVFDVSLYAQKDVNTTNNIRLISLPNDISLWTGILVSYADEYDAPTGLDPLTTENVAGVADNGGYLELQISSPNDIQVGDFVVLASTSEYYSGAVVRVISKDTGTGDITVNVVYSAETITAVSVYDISTRRSTPVYVSEGTTYKAVNNKMPVGNRYGANIAKYMNVETNTDLADNLSSLPSLGKFPDMFSDFTSIQDESITYGANELPALKIVQYDQNGAVLSTSYFTVTDQDEGVYRWLYTGGLTQQTLQSLNFNNEVLSQVIPLTGEFIEMQVATPFNKMLTANLTYQFNTTDSWGSPIINTTTLATFNAGMVGRATGFIRIVTSQTSFIEGGLIIQIDYEGFETDTSAITYVMPANRIDQDLVLYCQNFQINTLTSSQTGTTYAYGVRLDDVDAVDWTSFSTLAALTSLTALNTAIKSSSFKAVQLWFDEGTANTATTTKTISITGQFTDSRSRGYVGLLDRQADRTFRSALDNNGKVYDGTNDKDLINGFSLNTTQATTFFFVYFKTDYALTSGALQRLYYQRGNTLDRDGLAIFDQSGATGQIVFSWTGSGSTNGNTNKSVRVISIDKLKIGFNILQITYDGSLTMSGVQIYINGKLSGKTNIGDDALTSYTNSYPAYIGGYATADGYLKGRIRKFQIINRVLTAKEIRQTFLSGSCDTIIANADFLLDVDFNQTGTNELLITKGTYVYSNIISVADNGGGKPRFTINGTTEKSPVNGATVIISGTSGSYDTATTGAVITRISDSQFDITSQTFTVTRTGIAKVRITATGGAAYTDFYA